MIATEKEAVFVFAGDTGDLVYSLPSIRALGGGSIVCWPRSYVREPFSPLKVSSIASFFRSQSYINTFRYEANPNMDGVSYNLDDFRARWMELRRAGQHRKYNLAQLFLFTFGLPLSIAYDPWLTIDPGDAPRYDLCISRSPRYQNPAFPWNRVLGLYQNKTNSICFLGLESEHRDFCNQFSYVPYVKTPELLDAAKIIAGAKLFVGNQSALFAIATGLRRPRVLEVWRTEPNCIWPDAVNGFDENVMLPDLT